MTNGDKIRSMDDSNLAGMLAGYFATIEELRPYVPRPDECGEKCDSYICGCEECPETIERWLKAEVKE